MKNLDQKFDFSKNKIKIKSKKQLIPNEILWPKSWFLDFLSFFLFTLPFFWIQDPGQGNQTFGEGAQKKT